MVVPMHLEAEVGESLEIEAVVSLDSTTRLQPGQQSKTLPQKNKGKRMVLYFLYDPLNRKK